MSNLVSSPTHPLQSSYVELPHSESASTVVMAEARARSATDSVTVRLKQHTGVLRYITILGVILASMVAILCLIVALMGFSCYLQFVVIHGEQVSAFCVRLDPISSIVLILVSAAVANVGAFATIIGIVVHLTLAQTKRP